MLYEPCNLQCAWPITVPHSGIFGKWQQGEQVKHINVCCYISTCCCAVATAAYYVSFASVALVVFFMRIRHGYRSLPEAIYNRYGGFAALMFSLCVVYRLMQVCRVCWVVRCDLHLQMSAAFKSS